MQRSIITDGGDNRPEAGSENQTRFVLFCAAVALDPAKPERGDAV